MSMKKILLCFMVVVCVLSTGCSAHSNRRLRGGDAATMTNVQCKTVCQRFGFKSLGEPFKGISQVGQCVKKCDEVYPEQK